MFKAKLKNGLSLLISKRKSDSVIVAAQVNVGANDEIDSNRGISHFLEHMLFEGTKTRTSQEIANEIEKLGGELNAYTGHDRTVYYAVVPKKNFKIALEIISDIIKNPILDIKTIEKERKVILDEVNLTTDDPKFHQFVLFLKNLYKKHPIRHPLYGYKKIISKIARDDLMAYYNKFYVPNNISVAIVGDVQNVEKTAEKYFGQLKQKKLETKLFFDEPAIRKPVIAEEKRKILQSYIVFGYRAPCRKDKDSYAFDVIRAVLAKGQSSRLFDELRTKRGLCYFVGGSYEAGFDYGYFAIYVGTDKKNIGEVVNIIKKEIKSLLTISKNDLDEAKTFIEGSLLIDNENSRKLADTLLFLDYIDDKLDIKDYLKNIRNVTKEDIIKAAKSYFGENYVLSVIKQD